MKMFNSKKNSEFREKYSYPKRKDESTRIISKYPDRIPIICERRGINIPKVDKHKYLVPRELTIGQFLFVIRNRMKIDPSIGLYLFIGNGSILANTAMLISDCYNNNKDEDGFLYINYSGENTFGYI